MPFLGGFRKRQLLGRHLVTGEPPKLSPPVRRPTKFPLKIGLLIPVAKLGGRSAQAAKPERSTTLTPPRVYTLSSLLPRPFDPLNANSTVNLAVLAAPFECRFDVYSDLALAPMPLTLLC